MSDDPDMTRRMTPEQLAEKYHFAPGMPDDREAIPTLHYQVLAGRVYTLKRWKDGSTVRGELTLAEMEQYTGVKPTQEGWYTASGRHLGDEIDLGGWEE